MRVPSIFRNLFVSREQKTLAAMVTPYPRLLQFQNRRPVGPRPMPASAPTVSFVTPSRPALRTAQSLSSPRSILRVPVQVPIVEGTVPGLPVGREFRKAMRLQAHYDSAQTASTQRVRFSPPALAAVPPGMLSSRPVGLRPSLQPAALPLFWQPPQPALKKPYPMSFERLPSLRFVAQAAGPQANPDRLLEYGQMRDFVEENRDFFSDRMSRQMFRGAHAAASLMLKQLIPDYE